MLKKNRFFCLLVLFLSFITGCNSTKKVTKNASPMAIFSMSSNFSIKWHDDGFNKDENIKKGGLLSEQINKLIDKKNPENFSAEERLLKADEIFREKMQEIANIQIIDREDFLSSEAYSEQVASIFTYIDSRAFLSGYQKIQSVGRKKARIIMQELGLKGMFRFDFNFEKKLVQGNKWNGEVSALAEMKVFIIGANGKESRPITYTSLSPGKIEISGKNYDQQALVDLFPALIENLISKFIMDYFLE